jgi:hypothetical protein
MSSGQQNIGQGQTPKGSEGGNRQAMQQDSNNQMRMGMQGAMPGGMQGPQMGFPPNMMNYGVPNFMQHLNGMGPMNGQMMPGMYPGPQSMMGQEMQMKSMMQQNMGMGRQDSIKNQEGSKDRQSKNDDAKDQSRLQSEAKNSHIEKRDFHNDQDNGKLLFCKELSYIDEEDEPNSKNFQQNKVDRNQSSRRDESEPSKNDSKNVPDDEDDDGKYNLRKRTRKENPYYYCELSDEDKPDGQNRKRMKKYEDEYDPNEEAPSTQKFQANKQANQLGMGMQGNMDQNAMNNQMMMQQMANRSQQMMNMPNLNDSAGNLNQMMSGFNQNPMGQQNYMVC